jgi:hypothetical protein
MYKQNVVADEQAATRAMRIWKSKIDGSLESDRIVDKYERSYLDLVKKGIIGDENRLSWFETLQYIAESRAMASVKYAVASQYKQDSPTLKSRYAGLELNASTMQLDISMRHEGDLFALLGGLQDRAKGIFAVDKCDLEMIVTRGDETPVNNDMKASCELSWYSIKSAESTEGAKK